MKSQCLMKIFQNFFHGRACYQKKFKNDLIPISLNILKKDFSRNVLTMVTGTGLSQILLLAATPILTRLYSPSHFGALGLFVTTFGVLSVVACGRYEFAILIPARNDDAAKLVAISVALAMLTAVLCLCLLLLLSDMLIRVLGISGSDSWIWLLPLSVFFSGIFQTFNYWCVRQKRFRWVALSRLSQSALTVGSQLTAAILWKAHPLGLIGGYVIGQFAAVAALGAFLLKKDRQQLVKKIEFKAMLDQARLHKKFPLFNSWPSLLDSLRGAMPVMFLSGFFGTAVAGYYSLAMRVLWLPSSLLGTSISQVLFQRISEENNKAGKIGPLIEKSFQGLFVIAIPYFFLMLLSPYFFPIIFGSDWQTPGIYAFILAPATALMFIVSPLSITPTACNRQELSAGWQVSAVIITALSLAASRYLMSPQSTIIIYCINNVVLYLLYACLIFYVARAKFRNAFLPRKFIT